jgi:glucosamine 6-phosphate synthetase-like amidotransferase/phosphosugar isomerase protein
VALIHSEGVLAGEMKHGTLALVDETLPILVVRLTFCTLSRCLLQQKHQHMPTSPQAMAQGP